MEGVSPPGGVGDDDVGRFRIILGAFKRVSGSEEVVDVVERINFGSGALELLLDERSVEMSAELGIWIVGSLRFFP